MQKEIKNLFIMELANNHMGSVEHGENIIEAFSKLKTKFPHFEFAFKLQYRDLDTFIRQDYRGRTDIKHVKRFEETKLSRIEQKRLVAKIKECNFKAMCTPFDESSVNWIIEDGFDIIKIASCSCGDWPLLEKIASVDLPVVLSTAGAKLETIDSVVSFFSNRNKDFIIQHCVGEYPTAVEKMNLAQIEFLKKRFPGIRVGFSTHEDPENVDIIKMAVAKGATSFERHVGLPTKKWPLNNYSSTFEQTEKWLEAASLALAIDGDSSSRYEPSETELDALRSLQRGVFANKDFVPGEELTHENIHFAFPPDDDQLTSEQLSKYNRIKFVNKVAKGQPIKIHAIKQFNEKENILKLAKKVIKLLIDSSVTVPSSFNLELSHHYGLEKFEKFGLGMITLVNREYCKKILICLPCQEHPEQFHKKKEETFHVLSGSITLTLNGKKRKLSPGDVYTILPLERHAFVSKTGAIIEEISSSHYPDDSYYSDKKINENKDRKTIINYRIN